MFETHYPSAQFPKTESGRAMIIAAICICAEQTFTEASALRLQFSPAFQAALNAYVGSKIQADVNGKIAEFLEQDFAETIGERYRKKKKITPKLVEIIMDHPLPATACDFWAPGTRLPTSGAERRWSPQRHALLTARSSFDKWVLFHLLASSSAPTMRTRNQSALLYYTSTQDTSYGQKALCALDTGPRATEGLLDAAGTEDADVLRQT
ncbi:hypothetical protein C8J57DRAFT_1526562 [Mycena rebaudengoi]|nr:hypothetical protein C8J57DRAFT_1526562 [Mycena rebaudengoi]